MKLDVNFQSLWAQINKMGGTPRDFELEDLILPFDEIDSTLSEQGIEVELDELDTTGGLLSYKGRQVLLYIPDQGWRITEVLENGTVGKKFHVSHCRTLVSMKDAGRFERYVATNDLSGEFDVHGVDNFTRQEVEGRAELSVCKNCLTKLNYRDSIDIQIRKKVCREFSITEFFETYSTIFPYRPKQLGASASKRGYTSDWKEISARERQKKNYSCEECSVNLSSHKNLVHVHHINGVRSDNQVSNLRVLCAPCHKQQPYHSHVFIQKKDMQLITRIRNAQQIKPSGWDEVLKLADSAILGILGILRSRGVSPPAIGYEFTDSSDAVTAVVEAAWPLKRQALVLTNEDVPKERGWHFLTLENLTENPHLIHC
jgi:hypothetical protein